MLHRIPTALSYARALSACYLPALFIAGYPEAGLVCAGAAAITDWLDGFLARRWQCESEYGAQIDVVADKIFVWTLGGIVIGLHGLQMVLIAALAIVFVYDGAVGLLRWHGRVFAPSRAAKIKTAVLFPALMLLAAAPIKAFGSYPTYPLGKGALVVAAILCMWSMLHYLNVFPDMRLPIGGRHTL